MPDSHESSTPEQGSAREQVVAVINELRPFIQRDGGDLEFVDFTEDGTVQVRLHGACVGCPGAQMTLSQGVEARLKQAIPEVQRVACVNNPA